jgi:hypothetical protein
MYVHTYSSWFCSYNVFVVVMKFFCSNLAGMVLTEGCKKRFKRVPPWVPHSRTEI